MICVAQGAEESPSWVLSGLDEAALRGCSISWLLALVVGECFVAGKTSMLWPRQVNVGVLAILAKVGSINDGRLPHPLQSQ